MVLPETFSIDWKWPGSNFNEEKEKEKTTEMIEGFERSCISIENNSNDVKWKSDFDDILLYGNVTSFTK